MQEEQCLDENASKVKWHVLEYIANDATNQRKLYLATKETLPGEMFDHLNCLLKVLIMSKNSFRSSNSTCHPKNSCKKIFYLDKTQFFYESLLSLKLYFLAVDPCH